MGNRYLFRGKRIDNGEWVVGDLVHSVYKIGDTCIGQYGNEVGIHEVAPSTICQCTGLKDKNGKLIWEKDIVKCGSITVVIWDEHFASWCLTKKRWMFHHFWGEAQSPEDCEVIGNTFDNPELLEV